MLQSSESIGKYDRRLTFIIRITVTGDSNEHKITGWEALPVNPKSWARQREKVGNEVPLADRLTYVQETHFLIRHRRDLTVMMRVVIETGQVYEILSITEVAEGRKMFLNVACNLIQNEFWT